MFSLAALRYRSVSVPGRGPISRFESGEFPVFGRRLFQVNAWLAPGHVPDRPLSIYSNADGTGAHPQLSVARHMAVSEALERWAYHTVVHSAQGGDFGFDRDRSSNGMAAFPGLTSKPARRMAVLEAIERYSLLAWWEGLIDGEPRDTEWPGVSALAFEGPLGGVAVLLHRRSEAGFHSYGHAAAESFTAACEKGIVELARHEWVLRCRCLLHGGLAAGPAVANLLEQRSLFFATEAGYELFQQRLGRRAGHARPIPRVVADGEIKGPWTRYASVWRFALQPPSQRFLEDDERYFFW